ncbi:hypothetical protein [Nocardia tengchongensis]|uniref:hypothetical protein n=1 Tax=Nocardia tengchongensis TaxID=2055889 RepID=UPI0036C3E88B
MFAALAEFIRELIVEGTNEGLAAARARRQRLGRPPAMTDEQIRQADVESLPASERWSFRATSVAGCTTMKHVQQLQDSKINLLAAIIAFGVGLSTSQIRGRWRTRSTRRFWKPYASSEIRVITAVHRPGDPQVIDRSEWVGLGDVVALITLQEAAGALGTAKVVVRPPHRLNEEDWRSDLILIGGPSTNSVTEDALTRLPITVGYGSMDQPPTRSSTFRDKQTGTVWAVVRTADGARIRAVSPFNRRRTVLILAGGTALGTAGAAMLCQQREFLDHPVVRSGDPFEAVCSVDIAGGAPREVETILIRALEAS